MKNEDKTKDRLINELVEPRQRIAELEASETERKRMEEAFTEVNVRLQVLQRVTAAVHSTLDLRKIFRQITDGFVHSLGYTTALIMILNDEKKYFKIEVVSTKRRLPSQIDEILGFSLRNLSLPADPELHAVVRSVMKGEVVVAKTLAEIAYPWISKKRCSALQKLGRTKNHIVMPLKVEKEILGAVFITSSQEEVSEEELRMFELFARAASNAIKNANLHMQAKRVQEVLVQERNLLQALIDNIPDAIYFKDDKNRFVKVNKARADLSGSTLENMIGKTDFDFFLKKEAKEMFADDNRVMKSNRPLVDKVEKITHADRTKHWFSATKIPRHNGRGKVIGTMGISRDITERKKMEEELKDSRTHFQTLFNVMVDPVVIVDGKGKFLEVTKRVQAVTGFKREELLGKKFLRTNIMTERSKAIAIKNLAKRMMGMKIPPYQVELLTKDGKKIPYEVNAAKINYRGKPADMVVLRDISERKRVQAEVQDSLKKLRRALGVTIQAMALTVETRDAYTAGHQRRVTNLARAIATEMKLSKDQIDGIRMAGTIHDIGKIGVPAEILNKPVRLSDIEFNLIKTHPVVSYDILKQIEFPWPVAEIVLQHHERMNGSGYPHGLSGEDIMLEARILAVADVVEAMASHRPYRPAHSIDKTLEEILQNRGILYDPRVVDACLKLFTEKGFKFE